MKIKAIVLDVDGVLTDGKVYVSADGKEMKSLCYRDIMGISLAQKAGIRFALVSGECGDLLFEISMRCDVAANDVYSNILDKAVSVRDFAQRRGFDLQEIAYMGDDVNDIEAMKIVGRACAPADACEELNTEPVGFVWVMDSPGGNGAVRDMIDRILAGWPADDAVVSEDAL